MKKYFLLFVIATATILQSCDIEGSENYTPIIELAEYITNQKNQILTFRSTTEPGTVLLDTIYIGDTIRFSFYYNGFANNITSISLKQSADSLTRIELPPTDSLDNFFSAESDYQRGYFVLNQKATFVHFPFMYIPRVKSNEAKLTVTVTSDAQSDGFSGVSNQSEVVFKTPIKEAIVE